MRVILAALFSFALTACGGGSNPDNVQTGAKQVGPVAVQTVSGNGTLTFDSGTVTGVGSIRSATPLKKDEGNFNVTMNLPAGSRVTLHLFSSIGLENGLEVEFARPTNATALQVILRRGSTTRDVSVEFGAIDASQTLKFSIDVHNTESPAHMIFWNDTNGEADMHDWLFDSESVDASPGNGTGLYWGIGLQGNPVVSHIEVKGVRHDHHH